MNVTSCRAAITVVMLLLASFSPIVFAEGIVASKAPAKPANDRRAIGFYVRETQLDVQRDGIYLVTKVTEDGLFSENRAGPYSINDTIAEPYGLKKKLAQMLGSGLNIRGTQVRMKDLEGDHIKYLLKTTNHDDPKTAASGTYFYISELPEDISSESYFSILKAGNDGFPQVNLTWLTAKEDTVFPDASAGLMALEDRVAKIKDKDLVKIGRVKSKKGNSGMVIYALRFRKPVDFFNVLQVIDRTFVSNNSEKRMREVNQVLAETKHPRKKSYEHLLAIQYDDIKVSNMYLSNISIFTTKKAVRWRPAKKTAN